MDIQGIQKMTLLDFPGRVACTVFLAGCDLCCPFCHNSELIGQCQAETVMTDEELFSFLKMRRGLLDGVAVTGGEPLLRRDIDAFVGRIGDLGYQVKLDTNGNHPEALRRVITGGNIQYIAMDVKNSRALYARTCGREKMDLSPVLESIALLKEGKTDYEFRTTVVNELHNESSFEDIGEMISSARRYFLQPFTDRDTVRFSGFSSPSKERMEKYLSIVGPSVHEAHIRGMD